MSRLKTLVRNQNGVQPLRGGHALCQGCGIPLVVRTVLSTIRTPVVVVNATGCLEVATTRYPTTAWNVPWIHVAFENAAAVASGVESAQRALRRRHALPSDEEVAVVVFAGDGGTYDIGLQALSGALERGHRFLFVCYDNEAYMNTGIQRSGATPFAASTTTSPAGRESFGKAQKRKDMTAIAIGHGVPYVGQAASTHWDDLSRKVEQAVAADGPAFINVLTDCPLGWGHEARDSNGQPLDLVHRDVSPHNVLIGTDGIARVLDFGVAKARGRAQTTRVAEGCGCRQKRLQPSRPAGCSQPDCPIC